MLITPAVHTAVNLLRRIAVEHAVETANLFGSNMSAATSLVAEGLVDGSMSRFTADGWSTRLVLTAKGAAVAESFN